MMSFVQAADFAAVAVVVDRRGNYSHQIAKVGHFVGADFVVDYCQRLQRGYWWFESLQGCQRSRAWQPQCYLLCMSKEEQKKNIGLLTERTERRCLGVSCWLGITEKICRRSRLLLRLCRTKSRSTCPCTKSACSPS